MPATRSRLSDNLDRIRERIARAALRSGRDPSQIRLIVVTKTIDVQQMEDLAEIGVTDIGENRILDARAKKQACSGEFRWHLIGHLQRNKVNVALKTFDFFHSIDSIRLAEAFSERIQKIHQDPPPALIQVNISGETSKHGFSPEDLPALFDHAAERSLQLDGFMTMAPYAADEKECRALFRKLTRLRDHHSKTTPEQPLKELSMGMSRDFEIAIEEGATIVRVGSACFEGVQG